MNLIYLFTRVCSSSETDLCSTSKIPLYLSAFSSPLRIPLIYYLHGIPVIPLYSPLLLALFAPFSYPHLGNFRLFTLVIRCFT